MDETPIVAELAGEPACGPPSRPANRRGLLALVGCGLSLALLIVLLCGGVGYGVLQTIQGERQNLARRQARQQQLLAQAAGASERRAEIVAAFSAADAGVPPAELTRIQSLFDAAYAVKDRPANDPAVARVFDVDAFLERFLAWPESQSFSYLERKSARQELAGSELLDWLSARFRVTHVALAADGQSATAYGLLQFEYGGGDFEQRWQLVRRDSGWKLCDAEQCDQARWRSQFQARHFYYGYRNQPQWAIFDALTDEISAARGLVAEGRLAAAERKLTALNPAALDTGLQDEIRWRILGAYESRTTAAALRTAREIHSPDDWPLAWLVIARGEARRKDWSAAIEAGDRYAACVGPTPDVCRILLQAHQALGDNARCRDMCLRLLRFHPDDLATLAALAELGPQERDDVLGRLAAADRPLDQAVALLNYVNDDSHPEISDAVLAWLQRLAAESPRLAEARANLASRRGDDAAAAQIALDAARQHADDNETIHNLIGTYFVAMAALDRQEEAVAAWPDPLVALEFIADDFFYSGDYGMTLKALRRAVERAQAASPHDPAVRFTAAKLHARDGNHAAAERLLAELLPELKADGDEEKAPSRDEVVQDLASAQLKLGRVDDAVRTLQLTQDNEFGWLPNGFNLDIGANRDLVRRLVAARRAVVPGDPWCGIYEAELLEKQEEFEQAWRALPPPSATDSRPADYRTSALRGRLVASGQIPLAWYEAIPNRAAIFGSAARELDARQSWQRLEDLIALEQRRDKISAAELEDWLAESLFQRSEYARLVERFEPQADELFQRESVRGYGTKDAGDRLLRSLMRLGRPERVIELVERQPEGERNFVWLVWANLAAGRVEAATAIAGQPDFVYPQSIYHDDEFKPLMAAGAALPVRKRVPPPMADFWGRNELLFREVPTWSDAQLGAMVCRALGSEATVVRLNDVARLGDVVAWHVETPSDQRWLVVVGTRPQPDEDRPENMPTNAALTRALAEYQGWALVVPLSQSSAEEIAALTCRLLAGLATEEALAVRLADWSRLVAIDDGVRSALANPARRQELSRLGEMYFGWVVPEPADPSLRAPAGYWRDWMTFVRRLQKGEARDARVCVRLACGGLYEDLWLTADRLQGEPARYCTLVVSPNTPSKLMPQLKPGEPCTVSYSIRDFTAQIDGQTVRGRKAQ